MNNYTNLLINKQINPGHVCRSLDPFKKQAIVYTRHFPENDLNFSLRTLSLPDDLVIVHSLLKQECGKRFPPNRMPFHQLLQTLICLARSNYSQVFTGLLNSHPFCQVHLCHALQDEISLSYDSAKEDYIARFVMPCYKIPVTYFAFVQTCLEYFLLQTGIKRIITMADEENKVENKLIEKTGFRLLKQIDTTYTTVNLYVYSGNISGKTKRRRVSARQLI